MEAGCDERDPRIAFGCRTAAVKQPVDNIKRKDKVFLRALGLAFLNYTVGGYARRNKPFFITEASVLLSPSPIPPLTIMSRSGFCS